MTNKNIKRIVAIALTVLLTLSLASCGKTDEEQYPDFFDSSEKLFLTPGLDTEFVPQGVCFVDALDAYAVCGYMSDGAPSPIFITSKVGEVLKTLYVKNLDGSDYTGHAGGVAETEGSLWLSSGGKLRQLSTEEIVAAKDNDTVQIKKEFSSYNNASFVFSTGSRLIVGEFYEKKDYTTDETHHITTPSGDKHYAIATVFDIISVTPAIENASAQTELILSGAISTREKVQGFAATEDTVVLSTSYGRKNTSNLYVYDNGLGLFGDNLPTSDKSISLGGSSVPLYFLDSASLRYSLSAPPMTEGIDFVDGKLVVLFESFAKKYVDTAKYPQDMLFSLSIQP